MSERRIDWDYINQSAAMYIIEELSSPRYAVPRKVFVGPVNARRTFLHPKDRLIGCNEGLERDMQGYLVDFEPETSMLIFVASEWRSDLIDQIVGRLTESELESVRQVAEISAIDTRYRLRQGWLDE